MIPAAVAAPPPFDYELQPKEEVPSCNLCGRKRSFIIATRDRYGFHAPAVECASCGLVWLSPRMTSDAYAAFYASGAYRDLVSWYHGRRIDAKTIKAEQKVYATALHRLFPGRNKDVLDVGGSTGIIGRRLAGGRATVLDPAGAELAEARNLEAIKSSIEEFDPGSRTWGLVLCCQAVDHFLDVHKALETLRRCCAGKLWLDIVDWRRVAKTAGISGAMKIDHPFALEPRTMRSYLRHAGFTVEREGFEITPDHYGFVCS